MNGTSTPEWKVMYTLITITSDLRWNEQVATVLKKNCTFCCPDFQPPTVSYLQQLLVSSALLSFDLVSNSATQCGGACQPGPWRSRHVHWPLRRHSWKLPELLFDHNVGHWSLKYSLHVTFRRLLGGGEFSVSASNLPWHGKSALSLAKLLPPTI